MDSYTEELTRVMNGNSIMSPHRAFSGGEWDYLQALGQRRVRRLIGGGFLSAYGLRPDVAADIIREHVSGLTGAHHDDAMAWYVTTCEGAAQERRAERWRRQYANRNRRADALGFGTYHYHRLYRAALGQEAMS